MVGYRRSIGNGWWGQGGGWVGWWGPGGRGGGCPVDGWVGVVGSRGE